MPGHTEKSLIPLKTYISLPPAQLFAASVLSRKVCCVRFVVWYDFVVFLGSRIPGFFSPQNCSTYLQDVTVLYPSLPLALLLPLLSSALLFTMIPEPQDKVLQVKYCIYGWGQWGRITKLFAQGMQGSRSGERWKGVSIVKTHLLMFSKNLF